jgi:formylglycine-generating enzyme required for sulfatase activity
MKLYVSILMAIFTIVQYAYAQTVATAINFDGIFVAPILISGENTAVKYGGIVYEYTVVSKDEQSKIAVLRTECKTTPLKTGNSNNILVGSICRAVIFKPAEMKSSPVTVSGKVVGWQEDKSGFIMMEISFVDELPAGTPIVDKYGEIIAFALNNKSAVSINDVKSLLKSSKVNMPSQSKSVVYNDAVLPARLSQGIAFLTAGQPPLQTSVNAKDNAKLITIPAGSFLRGTKPTEAAGVPADELPQKSIMLDEYKIYRDEVTVKQYQQFCTETNRKMPKSPDWGLQDNKPMVNVTWQDAADYAAWAGGALPTEAQWEKAARGTDGKIFPWGNSFSYSRCVSLTENRTMPADEYDLTDDESTYGVRHTAGNVMEWCSDWFDSSYYDTGVEKNPAGPDKGTMKVLRGGSYRHNLISRFRCAYRFSFAPGYAGQGVGFRCVIVK